MTRYGSHHREATTAAVRNSCRFITTQRRMTLVITALARIGHAGNIVPRTADAGLSRTIKQLAASVDPTTDEGAAIIATAALEAKTFGAWIRRNRHRVHQILDAQKEKGPPP